jgi:chloride channel protein, CIC family
MAGYLTRQLNPMPMPMSAPSSPPAPTAGARSRAERIALMRRLRSLRRLVRANELALVVCAAVIGAGAGLVSVVLGRAVQLLHVVLFGIDLNSRLSAEADIWWVAALGWPLVGGVLISLSFWLAKRLKRSTAVDPIEANALRGGKMSVIDSLAVAGQTVVSNGFGASVGLEAAYAQMGAMQGSLLGRVLNLRRGDVRILVGAGAGAAIAGAFDAPLAGAFYGFEIILGAYTLAAAAPVLTAAISAVLVTEVLGGALYHIDVDTQAVLAWPDYAGFVVLGAGCAFLAIALMRLAAAVEGAFVTARTPLWLRPLIGGLAVGALGILTPQVLSAGHGALEHNLASPPALQALVLLIVLKMLASSVSLGSGFRGGLFFASLLIGALAGLAFAELVNQVAPGSMDPMAAALTGMGAFAAAIVGGPLTMAFLVLGTTGDYALSGIVLAAAVFASLTVRMTFGYSFSTWRLHLRGESIRSAHDVGRIRSLTVGSLMRRTMETTPASISLAEFQHKYPLGARGTVMLVDEQERFAGAVLVVDAHAEAPGSTKTLADIARGRGLTLTPEMNIQDAMAVYDRTQEEVLPVVDRQSGKLIGVLNESYAIRRYAEVLDASRRELVGEPSVRPRRPTDKTRPDKDS